MARHRILGKIDLMSSTQQTYDLSNEEVSDLKSFRQGIAKTFGVSFYELPENWRKRKKNIQILFTRYSKYFQYWYYPGLLDIKEWSLHLARLNSVYFEDWWDPSQFNWDWACTLIQTHGSYFTHWYDPSKLKPSDYRSLASHCGRFFDVWWNKDIYPENGYYSLISGCSDHIHKWWDPSIICKTQYDYTYYVSSLMSRCRDSFDIWWNKEMFDYESFSQVFLENVPNHFYQWFDIEKIPDHFWESYSWAMAAQYPNEFKTWFDKKKFQYGVNKFKVYGTNSKRKIGREYLIIYCYEYFLDWYDKRRIRATRDNLDLLEKYCYKYRGQWGSDFIVLQLQEEGDSNDNFVA